MPPDRLSKSRLSAAFQNLTS
ncbi:MAG: hypothetical protein K0R62_4524, partial [Nonomuraea muscovyensis]|nr:hypothetical protein [Nonomuraea muscovyensis]